MLLVIDNYDSFTWNLVQAFQVLGAEVDVRRHDQVDVPAALALGADGLVISPGPGAPRDAGVSLPLIAAALGRLPLLGVCLGHQALCQALGARIVPARRLVHGKQSLVQHDGSGLFAGLPSPLPMGRYHSLAVEELPPSLVACAWAEDGEIMAVRHASLPAWGVQFHPESVLSPRGPELLAAFLRRCPLPG
jgi:anthranilate synthase/aminodeoxychorismate synthase-like glutamine amidotransferase